MLTKLFFLVLVAVGSARAQTPTGTIAGVVTDPGGAPIAGARIKIINHDSGLTRTLETSSEGDYSAPALPPGVYQVTVEATGFSLLDRKATVETGANHCCQPHAPSRRVERECDGGCGRSSD